LEILDSLDRAGDEVERSEDEDDEDEVYFCKYEIESLMLPKWMMQVMMKITKRTMKKMMTMNQNQGKKPKSETIILDRLIIANSRITHLILFLSN
jgi:hypothetical protein